MGWHCPLGMKALVQSQRYVPRLERVCRLCTIGTIGDENHLLLESPELQESRDRWVSLFTGLDTVQEFMGREVYNQCS